MEKLQYPTISFMGKETFTPVLFADESFIFDWEVNPGHVVVEHIHPNVDERFEITHGEITFKIQGKIVVAKTGEVLTIPKGVPHEIKNATKNKAGCRVSYLPAGDQGKFFDVGLFLLNENPASNGSIGMVFKMMYIAKQMNFEDFSQPANAVGKALFATFWGPVKLYGDIAGWGKITQRYKTYRKPITA